VREGKAVEVPVQAAVAVGDLVQVAGVDAGDKVVLKPHERVRDGTHVSVPGK